MLKQRVLTAIVLLGAFLGALFFAPPWLWLLLVSLVCAGGAWEWGGLSGFSRKGRTALAASFGIICLGLGIWSGMLHQAAVLEDGLFPNPRNELFFVFGIAYLLCGAFWLFCVPMWLACKWHMKNPVVATVVGFIVLLPTAFALVLLRHVELRVLLLILLLVWVADIAAYFTGRTFGKHKLAPEISPGKTWEGALGALLGVMLAAVVVAVLIPRWGMREDWVVWLMALPLFTAISIEGDLFESLLKRQAGIKDSGTILPGHGGILDRIDSLTSVLPMVIALMTLLWAGSHY